MNGKRRALFGICLIVLIGAIIYIAFYYSKQQVQEQGYEDLAAKHKTQAVRAAKNVIESPQPTDQEPEPKAESPEIPVDFAALMAVNPEIYAWITIPDTKVDYPILQSGGDQNYYLNHTAEKAESIVGAIYTQNMNDKAFGDKNTVIYGHNMRNGTMFGELHRYVEEAYMKAHPNIYIWTPEHIYTYQVFAAVTYDNRHILESFDFQDEEQYQGYLASLRNSRYLNACWNDTVAIDTDMRIITLSTCNGSDEQRFLVEAVLVSEE